MHPDPIRGPHGSGQEVRGPGMGLEEFFKAINRLSWAISLLAVQQLGNTMSSLFAHPGHHDDSARRGNELGNTFPHAMRPDMTFQSDAFSFDAFNPRTMFRAGIQLLQQSADVLKTANPQADGRIAWQELQNKLEAFSLFEQVDSELNISSRALCSLPEWIDRARLGDSYRALWLMEGLGHYYSDLCLRRGDTPSAILSGPLPAASLVPLHAGMGLAFAEWLLPAIEQNPAASLHEFIELCKANSESGYFGVACEALGLATRNLFPHLLAPIDEALSLMGEELVAYFWHGAGRAIYFSPTNFLPWRAPPWQGLESCFREPPHKLGQDNAVAGFCWALTLVNVREPQIIEAFLKHHAGELTENDACANGIRSALIVWADATSCARCFDALRRYQPEHSVAALWQKHIRQACEKAMEYGGVLRSGRAMVELFRYQSLGELIARANHGDTETRRKAGRE